MTHGLYIHIPAFKQLSLSFALIKCNRTASRPRFIAYQSPENRWINVDNNPFPLFHSIFSTSNLASADKSASHLSKAKASNTFYRKLFPFFFYLFFFIDTSAILLQLVKNCCILKCLDSLSVRSGLAQSTAPATWGNSLLHSSTMPV